MRFLSSAVAPRQTRSRSFAMSSVSAALALRERSGLGTARVSRRLARPLDVAQTLLPGPLQRTRHKPVLRLHLVILPARPFGLVAGPLAPQRPLVLQCLVLRLELANGSHGHVSSGVSVSSRIRSQAASTASARTSWQRGRQRRPVGAAVVDGIVAMGPDERSPSAAHSGHRPRCPAKCLAAACYAGLARIMAGDVPPASSDWPRTPPSQCSPGGHPADRSATARARPDRRTTTAAGGARIAPSRPYT